MSAAILHLPLARLTRVPRAWLAIVGWAALGAFFGWSERSSGAAHAADRALGAYGEIVLPLLVLGVVSNALGGEGLRVSVRSVARFGASTRRVALLFIGTTMLVSAALSALLAVMVVVISGSSAVDAITSAWVCGLGGAAYAALFSFGASFGKHGGGRAVFLVADWILGGGTGVGAAFTPRGNLQNLLGGAAPGELSQPVSTAILLGLLVLFVLLAARRAQR